MRGLQTRFEGKRLTRDEFRDSMSGLGMRPVAQLECTYTASDKLSDGMPISEGSLASGILQSSPRSAGYDEVYLKCFYTNVLSMRNKQGEPKT